MFGGFGARALLGGVIGGGLVAATDAANGKKSGNIGMGALVGAGLFMGAHGLGKGAPELAKMWKGAKGLGKSGLEFGEEYGKKGINHANDALKSNSFAKASNYFDNIEKGAYGKFPKVGEFLGSGSLRMGMMGGVGGAAVGATYGLVSPKETMMGGAFKGAVLGAIGGMGAGYVKNLAPISTLGVDKAMKTANNLNMKTQSVGRNRVGRHSADMLDPIRSNATHGGAYNAGSNGRFNSGDYRSYIHNKNTGVTPIHGSKKFKSLYTSDPEDGFAFY